MRARWLVAIALLIVGGGLWQYLYRPNHKYRLTVSVLTPNGLVSGSSVIAVYLKPSIRGIGAGAFTKGNAVFVDLGNGRSLIALLARGRNAENVNGMADLAQKAFASAGQNVPFAEVKYLHGSVPVQGDLIPTLTTLTNPADLLTAKVVDPSNLAAVFGAGFRLQGVTLEMLPVGLWPLDFGGFLGEPPTEGIEHKLSWWNGPFPWLKPIGSGIGVDQRRGEFRPTKELFRGLQ